MAQNFCFDATELSLLSPDVCSKGSDVSGRGEHVLLLFTGGQKVPCAVGASGSLRPGGGTAEPGGSQAAKAGCVW